VPDACVRRGVGPSPLTLPGLADGDSPAGLRLCDTAAHVVSEIENATWRMSRWSLTAGAAIPPLVPRTSCQSASRW
jgi:hypothetical protein